MKITTLNGDLHTKFLDVINDSIDELYNHPERQSSQSNFHLLSEKGKYSSKVFEYYSKMNQTKEDLRKIEIFLRRFPLKKFYEDNEISHLDYIKYHTEVFYHKITTLLDLFKIIINRVYELGLSEKKCTWENLIKSEKLKQSMLIKVVECYYKSFESVINARNLNTHRGHFYDSEKDNIEDYMFIYKNSEKFNVEIGNNFKKMMPKFYLEYKLKVYKKDKLKFIQNGNKVAEEYANIFSNVMYVEFLKISKNKSKE